MKSYSDLSNFAHLFYADNGISFAEFASENAYENNYKAMQKYIALNYNKNIGKEGWNTSNGYSYKTLSGSRSYSVCDDLGLYVGPGGRFYGLNNPPKKGENGPVMCVDTNGRKSPNKYGYDFFIFLFTVDGEVIPMGTEHPNNPTAVELGHNFSLVGSRYCSKKDGGNFRNNMTCAHYALADESPANAEESYWNDFL